MNPTAAARAHEIAEQAEQHFEQNPGKIFIPKLGVPLASNALPSTNNVTYDYESIDEAFPAVDAGIRPVGNMMLVQVRQPKLRTNGGIIISADERKTDHDNTQVAKVLALGPLAFRNRDTFKEWPEGAWCKVGDFVRIPKYQPDYIVREYERDDTYFDDDGRKVTRRVRDFVHFALIKDLAINGVWTADPLSVRAYL